MRIRYLGVGLLLLLGIVAQSPHVSAAPRLADAKADMRALDAKLVAGPASLSCGRLGQKLAAPTLPLILAGSPLKIACGHPR